MSDGKEVFEKVRAYQDELVAIRRDLRKWAHEHRDTPEVAPAP